MTEYRCEKCNRLLFKMLVKSIGYNVIDIKCNKCKSINRIIISSKSVEK